MNGKVKQVGLLAVGAIAGVLVSIGISAVAQRDARPPLPLEELRQFSDVFGAIKSNYVEPVEDKKLITEAISGMLSGLDPHSQYLDAEAFRELQVGTQGEFGGLGIEVGTEDGFVRVVAPIEDTPAFKAGIKAGDLIIKIDEKPTKGMALNEAVKLMRGKPRTQVTLTLSRKGESRPIVVQITRDVIRVQSVKSKSLEPGYGYVRITQFQEHTVENMVRAIENLYKQQGPLKGLVLDLRNDPGGLLHGAIGVSAAFLPPRTLVTSTDGRTDDARRRYLATAEDYLRGGREDHVARLPREVKTVPMVVLVNGGSASASEIVAGALQDHKRAVVMGTQTFGKGSVQSILPLTNNTAIKLTTARYYTPSGRSIQAKGIAPDFLVEETPEGETNQFRVREADLSRHLSNDKEAEERPAVPRPDATAVDPKLRDRKPVEFGSADDHQLAQAMNHLKGRPVAVSRPRDAATAATPAAPAAATPATAPAVPATKAP
jgi:carboxyl-terminal processing protease